MKLTVNLIKDLKKHMMGENTTGFGKITGIIIYLLTI
jgi:hypothetical protein